MSTQNAKFFCESCGAEVPRNARFCKKCGRFFSSVRCPNCGATGSPDKFANGCPKCGYTVDGDAFQGSGHSSRSYQKEGKISRKTKKNFRTAILAKAAVFNSDRRTDESLPFWMYILTGLVLIGLLFFIMHYFGR